MKETTEHIACIKNFEDGMAAHVAKIKTGFSVTLQDMDSGEFLPTSIIFPALLPAMKKAMEVLN